MAYVIRYKRHEKVPACMTLCLCIDSILFGVCQDPTVEFDVSALHLSPNF